MGYDCWGCHDRGVLNDAYQTSDGRVVSVTCHCPCPAGARLKALDTLEREEPKPETLDTLDREDS